MSDLRRLVAAARELRRRGEPFVVATVVRVRGSAYRKPGARMILTTERCVAGSVSGGCIESDLVRKLAHRMRAGGPVVVTYETCNGSADILLESGGTAPTDPMLVAEQCIVTQQRATLLYDLEAHRRFVRYDDGSTFGDARLEGSTEVVRDAIAPPPRLFVFGTGDDALPVVHLARCIGWEVAVSAPHGSTSVRERFHEADALVFGHRVWNRIAKTYAPLGVVMSHDVERDEDALAGLVRSKASYVGVLGPASRTEELLAACGLPRDSRLHAPVGLDIGAETPEEIALAIVAEARASLAHRAAARVTEVA